MISVKEARRILDEAARTMASDWRNEKIPLSEASGRVLAEPVMAPLDAPLFDNSAMDGFALNSKDTSNAADDTSVLLKIAGEIKAGDPPLCLSFPHACIRIMTGAPLPEGCDAVIMKEKVTEQEGSIRITQAIPSGNNIRRRGEDIKVGEPALGQGTRVHAGAIGFLASLGIYELKVSALPRISILVTGNELVEGSENLKPGKILDSNSWMLTALLKEKGFPPEKAQRINDEPSLIRQNLERTFKNSDVVIVTGGVSVGDYDFTHSILGDLGVTPLFWKVRQRPGKPLYTGRLQNKIIFGLPGNPCAAYVCFHVYILPFLSRLTGNTRAETSLFKIPLACDWNKKESRYNFLKGKKVFHDNSPMAQPLSGQGSHKLRALTESDILICLPEEVKSYQRGELVEVLSV